MSKLIKLFKWSAIVSICILYGLLTGSYVTFRFCITDFHKHWMIIHQAESVFFTLLFICSVISINRYCRKNNRDVGGYIRSALVVGFAVLLIITLCDEPLIKSKYNWEDVAVPEKDSVESYQIIADNFDHKNQKIDVDLSEIDIKKATLNPLAYEDAILEKWKSIKEARSIIDQLNEFNEIADLSEPDETIDINIMEFEFIARVYRLYALFMIEKEESIKGIHELNKIHSIAKKALPYARYLINKTIWIVIAERNIQTAYSIARRSKVDLDAIEELKKGFKPLSKKEISYKNAFITESFFMRNESIKDMKDIGQMVDGICSSFIASDICDSSFKRYYLKLIFPVILQKNKTANIITKKLDLLIKGATLHPPEFETAGLSQLDKPVFKNSGSWILFNLSNTDLTFYPIRAAKTKTLSDILAIYLYKKTGAEIILGDYFTGEKYVETSDPLLYKSPGYDQKLNTEDDVYF
ncbi:MAG: hypothetical protein ABIK92_01770 [Pseudomonadota bacterium]